MMTPAKGDYASVPLNADAARVADTWDPARDEAAGEQCRSYGAPAIMRVPGRLHITWQDDATLRIDTDAGSQTRLLRFGVPGQTRSPGLTPPSPRRRRGRDSRLRSGNRAAVDAGAARRCSADR